MDGTGGRRQQGKGTGRGKGTCTGTGKGTGTGRGRSTSFSSSQRSLNQKKDPAVLGFPCKKPVRIGQSLKKQIDGRSEKATGRTPSLLLGAHMPEKKCSENSSSRVKNKGVAMSVKEVANHSRKLLQSSNDSTARPKRNQRQKSISAPPNAPKTRDFCLPDKYEMLAELFDSMDSAIKLLRLRKANSSFCKICPQVESMTHKRFMYNHVAQMKHILPEGLLLEKIMTHDEETLCMKPELKITVLHDAVLSGKSKVSKANNTLGLRKAFRTRLMEFVKAHPNGDDVPEAILPEPFNRKCQLTSPGCSLLPPVICKSLSPARGVSSDPPVPHQEDPQPSMMSSLLPKNFQRRFSQRNFTAEPSANPPFPVPEQVPDLKPLSEVPETAKPDGFGGVLPSSLHSHLSPGFKSHFAVNFCPTANTQDIKEANEIKSKSSTSNKSHLESPISESCRSSEMRHFQQTPSKVPNPDPVVDGTIDVGTACKTASASENPNSPISKGYFSPVTPRVTRRSVALKTASDVSRTPCKTASESENPNSPISKGYFSPVTPRVTRRSVALKTASDVSSAVETPIVKSILKSNIKSPISKKSLRFAGVSAAPITSPPVLPPGTPGFASPEASRLSQPTVKRSNNTNVKRAIAFNRSEKDSSAPPAYEQPGTLSTPLKRKAEEANLDDDLTQSFQSPQSLVLSAPAKSDEWGNHVDSFKSSPLRKAANPFAISKKNEKVMQNSTYPQHDRKTFSLENTPVKGFPNTPPLLASKRFRFSVDESQTLQVDTTKNCSETGLLCLRSPKKSNAEPCKLDIDRELNVSEPAEKTSNNIQESCKIHIDGMSQSDQEIIGSIPMPVLQEVYEKELKMIEECKSGVSAANRRQQMIACLPRLFNMIRDIFRLSKRSVLTRQELVHKIISNHTDVTDRSEVEEQLHLLGEIAPEWISGRIASTGDFLYSVKSNIDLSMIHARFASAL